MPNPLMHGPLNTSDAAMSHHPGQVGKRPRVGEIETPTGGRATSPPDDEGKATDPIQYNQAGNGRQSHNNAYRGVEQHGVDNSSEWIEPNEAGLVLPDEYVEPQFVMPKEPPIRVEVRKGLIDWGSRMFPVADTPVRIAGRKDSRVTIQIINNDAANKLYIGSDESVSASFAGWIAFGQSLKLENAQTAVWAICDPTKTCQVTIVEEFISDDQYDLSS